MDADLVFGAGIALLAVLVTIGLYLWSYRIIEQIHGRKLGSLRQIRKELKNGGRTG